MASSRLAQQAEYRVRAREHRLAYNREYRQRKFSSLRTALQAWRLANPEKYRAQQVREREKNRERNNRLQRERRAANPEKYRAKQRARYASDPVKLRSYRLRRVYREKLGHEMAGSHTTYQWTVKLMEFGGCCAHCGTNERIERDHIIPITRGGSDRIENIQPLCRSCNARKSATVAIAA